MRYKLFSNAKINLFLNVLYKRKDGYHQLESIFLPIDFGDFLILEFKNKEAKAIEDFEFSSKNQILLENNNDFDIVSEKGDWKKNLIFKVFEKILEFKIPIPAFHIHLEKHIPLGSGLGGGSSNAGTLIRFFLSQGWISKEKALTIAKSLGSDIPFFLNNLPSIVSGRGEIIEDLPTSHNLLKQLNSLWGILCINSFSVSTREAYELLHRPEYNKNQKISFFSIREELLKNPSVSYEKFKNDFEYVIFPLKKELKGLFDEMQKTHPFYLRMTGSGSSLYAFYESREKRLEAITKLKKLESSYGRKIKFLPFKLLQIGQWPSGKASDFGSDIRRFESSLPSH